MRHYSKMPKAFVLQLESQSFLTNSYAETIATGDKLIALIRAEADVVSAIKHWETLSFSEKTPIQRRIFAMEVNVLVLIY
jgi:hypothetical protein